MFQFKFFISPVAKENSSCSDYGLSNGKSADYVCEIVTPKTFAFVTCLHQKSIGILISIWMYWKINFYHYFQSRIYFFFHSFDKNQLFSYVYCRSSSMFQEMQLFYSVLWTQRSPYKPRQKRQRFEKGHKAILPNRLKCSSKRKRCSIKHTLQLLQMWLKRR